MQKLFAVELVLVLILFTTSDGILIAFQSGNMAMTRKSTAPTNGLSTDFLIRFETVFLNNDENVSYLFYYASGESLKCYVCRSDTDEGCDGNMNDTLSIECPAKENKTVYCRKIHQKLRFRGEEKWTSIRECAYERGSKSCYIFKWPKIAYQETCECDQNNCNRGYLYHPNIMTVTSIFSMLVLNYLKTDHT